MGKAVRVLCLLLTLKLGDCIHIATPPDIGHLKDLCPKYSVLATDGVHVACLWCALYCNNRFTTDCMNLCQEYVNDHNQEHSPEAASEPTAMSTTTQPTYLTPEVHTRFVSDNSNWSISSATLALIILTCLICGVFMDRLYNLFLAPRLSSWYKMRSPKDRLSMAAANSDDPEIGRSSNLLESPAEPTPQSHPSDTSDDEGEDLLTMNAQRPGPVTGGNIRCRNHAENDNDSTAVPLGVPQQERSYPGTSMRVNPSSAASRFELRSQQRT